MTARSTKRDLVDSFIVGSGVSQHMVNRRSVLENINNSGKSTIIIGDGRNYLRQNVVQCLSLMV